METRKHIIETAIRLFSTLGYSNVTTDRIAHQCGISKATLYRIFPSKDALLMECIQEFTTRIGAEIELILSDTHLSPRDKISGFLQPVLRFVSGISPEALSDLQRFAPEAYAKIEESRRRLIFGNILRVVEEGRQNHLLRQDLNAPLLAHVLIGTVSHLSLPEVQSQIRLPFDQQLQLVLNLLWEGALSEQGRSRSQVPIS